MNTSDLKISEERSGKDTLWVARNHCPGQLMHGSLYCTALTESAMRWMLGRADIK